MFLSLPRLFRLVWFFLRGHQALVVENFALRQQLSIENVLQATFSGASFALCPN
jgi:hypothetical protein